MVKVDIVSTVERRRFIRHPLSLPLAYKIISAVKKSGPEDSESQTSNISLGGLLFPAKKPVKKNAFVLISMPFEGKTFNIKAKVLRCNFNSETRLYDIGVKFFRLHEAFKVKMIEQIYLITEYRDLLSLQTGKEVSLEEASRKWVKRYSERFKRLYW
jgi:c-di-GMP-binding flagellar brake protein YcgR